MAFRAKTLLPLGILLVLLVGAAFTGASLVGSAEGKKHTLSEGNRSTSKTKKKSTTRPLVLKGPAPTEGRKRRLTTQPPPLPRSWSRTALALYFRTDIFASASKRLKVIGFARRGSRLPVTRQVWGSGCKRGTWYAIHGGGYVCTRRGFLVRTKPPKLDLHYRLPDTSRLLPFSYAKVKRDGVARLFRPPTEAEDKQIAALGDEDDLPEVVDKLMKGAYFLALDETVDHGGKTYYRTVRGRHVLEEELDPRDPPPMRGELLQGAKSLPLAFVYDKDRPVYRLRRGELVVVGRAEKHARFRVRRTVEHGGKRYVQGPGGLLVARTAVRVARAIHRPAAIPAGRRWIHVDLARQTLVAYEGQRPVLATVVSSGKEGFTPPLGTFRIHKKYISTTMNGPDPDVGWYEVEEVPWTMYYFESYALHGTYWHDEFGKPRSHGCTNIAPEDARWLFYWTDPALPARWHGIERKGTHVHFSKSDPQS
jgi:hypothetical protein